VPGCGVLACLATVLVLVAECCVDMLGAASRVVGVGVCTGTGVGGTTSTSIVFGAESGSAWLVVAQILARVDLFRPRMCVCVREAPQGLIRSIRSLPPSTFRLACTVTFSGGDTLHGGFAISIEQDK
jgi:hypothetical protein